MTDRCRSIIAPTADDNDELPDLERHLMDRILEALAESGLARRGDLRVLAGALIGLCRRLDVDPVSYVAGAAAASEARDASVN